MTEYLSPSEIDKRLGLIPPEEEPEEIVIKGIHRKRVGLKKLPKNPKPIPEAASTKQENNGLAGLKASVTELQEEKPKTLEELAATKDRLSELEEKVRAIEQATMESVEPPTPPVNEIEKVTNTEEEKPKLASLCPGCGKDVGWDSLDVIEEGIGWPLDIFFYPVKYKECPECAYYEQIKELEGSQAGKLPDEEVTEAEQVEAEAEKPEWEFKDDPVLGIFFD